MPTNPYRSLDVEGGATAFVGRAAELAQCLAAIQDPARRCVLVYGPPGMGKSALLGELAARLDQRGDLLLVPFDLAGREGAEDTALALIDTLVQRLGLPAAPEMTGEPWSFLRNRWLPEVLDEIRDVPVFLVDGYRPGHSALLEGLLSLRGGALRGRVALVLVLDGGMGDLSGREAARLDGICAQRVGPLGIEETRSLVRLGEENGTLRWTAEAVEQVWRLSGGHPALVHHLCAEVWAACGGGAEVTAEAVGAAVAATLVRAEPVLVAAWERASAACRLVAATLAPLGGTLAISGLDDALAAAGVPLRLGWLLAVNHLVEEWEIVSPDPSDEDLVIASELMRRWIANYRPAGVVYQEMPEAVAHADPLLVAAIAAGGGGGHDRAVDALRRLLEATPDRLAALELEADLLYDGGRLEEATVRYRSLHERLPVRAAPWLARCLVEAANRATDLHQRLSSYQQALAVVPGDPDAQAGYAETWATRGRQALDAGRLVEAVEAFRAAGRTAESEAAMARWRVEQADVEWAALEQLVAEQQYAEAEVRLRAFVRLFREDRPDALRVLEGRIAAGLARVPTPAGRGVPFRADPLTEDLTSEEVDTPTSVPPPVIAAVEAPPVSPPVAATLVTQPPARVAAAAPAARVGRLAVGLLAVIGAILVAALSPWGPGSWRQERVTFLIDPAADARLWVDGVAYTGPGPQLVLPLAAGPHFFGYTRGATCDARCPGDDCPACCASCLGRINVTPGTPLGEVSCAPKQRVTPEVCDLAGVDEDCNGLVNDADPGLTDGGLFSVDSDGDGHGARGAAPRKGCGTEAGVTSGQADDCDDTRAEAFPGGVELAGNLVDEDCDGVVVYAAPGADGLPGGAVPGRVDAGDVQAAVSAASGRLRGCFAASGQVPAALTGPAVVRLAVYPDRMVGAVSFPPRGAAASGLERCLARVFWPMRFTKPGVAAGSVFDVRIEVPAGETADQ